WASRLLGHHLTTLERNDLIERIRSAGDGRRRYIRLRAARFDDLLPPSPQLDGTVLFVCTHNSARSQLAAAIWREYTGRHADSAGTEPADRVHPGAEEAARRHGIDLGEALPRTIATDEPADVVVTVCDRAHEQLTDRPIADGQPTRHWSIGDPAAAATDAAFDDAVRVIFDRIRESTEPKPKEHAR
ncbi:MAG: hypothetical protein AAFY28_19490, partial [Actinomycetota bacterium]